MKVLFPKNIKKGLFGTMQFQIGPLTISVIQLFILAAGVALALGVFNATGRESRLLGIVLAIPVFLVFVVIAFFQVSELSLIPFLAKIIQTYFFDATKKFQVNYEKLDQIDILIKENKHEEKKQIIQKKTEIHIDQEIQKAITTDKFITE